MTSKQQTCEIILGTICFAWNDTSWNLDTELVENCLEGDAEANIRTIYDETKTKRKSLRRKIKKIEDEELYDYDNYDEDMSAESDEEMNRALSYLVYRGTSKYRNVNLSMKKEENADDFELDLDYMFLDNENAVEQIEEAVPNKEQLK